LVTRSTQDGSPSAFLDRYGNLWHSDTESDKHLDGVTMLYCVKTPDVGGDTLFASSGDACRASKR
jgi:taurine dioxygenase